MGITSLLNGTFVPQTLTISNDGMGSKVSSWTDGTAFRGRLTSLLTQGASMERMSSSKVILDSTHKLFCNNQTISPISRIRNNDSTRFFEITGIINPSNINHHLELLLKEIDTHG